MVARELCTALILFDRSLWKSVRVSAYRSAKALPGDESSTNECIPPSNRPTDLHQLTDYEGLPHSSSLSGTTTWTRGGCCIGPSGSSSTRCLRVSPSSYSLLFRDTC